MWIKRQGSTEQGLSNATDVSKSHLCPCLVDDLQQTYMVQHTNVYVPTLCLTALIHKLLNVPAESGLIGLHGGIPPPTSFPLTGLTATVLGGTSLAITEKEQVCLVSKPGINILCN